MSLSAAAVRSPQDAPVRIRDRRAIDLAVLRVDHVQVTNRRFCVSGWAAGPCTLQLLRQGVVVAASLTRTPRPDAALALGIAEPPGGLGFELRADAVAGDWQLRALVVDAGETTQYDFALKPDRQLREPRASSSRAVGALEAAAVNPLTGVAVVVGWVLHQPGVRVALEKQDGTSSPLEPAYRFFRRDVDDLHGNRLGGTSPLSGFVALVPGLHSADKLRLVYDDEDHRNLVSEVDVGALPLDPVLASRWLFSLGSPACDFVLRVETIDAQVLEPLVELHQRKLGALATRVRQLGDPASQALVSVIVPLYGRSDFVEHQMLEFARDDWFVRHADLVYVVDDPRLVDAFAQEAEQLWRLYRIPFRWVDAGANRGFAGANNLGTQHARADTLLFLNSDVFPQSAGWLPKMLERMDEPGVGAIGARLTRADGSIQHAGMEFLRRDDLGIWINHHPRMGLPTSLDPCDRPTKVPAVTGACLMVRRRTLDAVGGWDTGYLVGDFEDSDLCLKLRAIGLDTLYVPDVQLTHLERQSMPLVGDGDFRSRLVIYNALRHQRRWAPDLQALGSRA